MNAAAFPPLARTTPGDAPIFTVSRLNREGHTILLTTHYLEEAEALCNRIAMLKRGRIVALDTTQALLESTGVEDLEEAFVQIMNSEDPARQAA